MIDRSRYGARRLHIADDGLPTVIDVDVLDANILIPTMTQPSKNLDLGRIGSQQSSRRGGKRDDSVLRPTSPAEPGQNGHNG